MYKIAILGCENSHANSFLKHVQETDYKEKIEFVGVYSNEEEAAQKLHDEFGVYVAKSYDEFVGKVDAIIVTARHGDNHYKYAKPYIKSGIPMFIDKPITCSEEDANAFMDELIENNVPVFGGSVCVYTDHVQSLKKAVQEETYGKVMGGFLRAPLVADSPYGGFYFYSQHLAQITMEIFGNYPHSVIATNNGKHIDCILKYEGKNVHLCFTDDVWTFYAGINCVDKVVGDMFDWQVAFSKEFDAFYALVSERKMVQSYKDFFAPVYVLNAIERALKSGKEEKINRYEGKYND